MVSRNHTYWVEESEEWVTTLLDISWDELRFERNSTLNHSDWRFMSDQTPSQEWIDYRQFLRDLPQNYDTANEAADAWNEYNKPE
tara:strand:- start:1840 stop:2094 length:255 start_codon:yes stop_codon:yes gene_type:complete